MKGNRHSSVTPILLVLLVLFGGFGAVRASAQSYVFNANAFATGKSPEAVVTGDFNGDGQPDVAVANQGANTVSILLGQADATFKAHVDYAVGSDPIGIVAADFNGDGKLDLAVVNSSSNSVSVLIGNGDGTFQNQAVNSVGVNPQSIAAGDLNGDGKMDLVVANFNDNTVSVLLGNGDGTFQAQVTYQTGTGPTSVAIADFNADGKLDLVTADKSINSVSVLLGNGDGTFQAQAEYATGRNPVQVVVGDFNNDGKPDVAAADGGDGNVSILINSGNSTKLFPTVTTPSVYTLCTSLVVGDFNGDHNLDLAVSSAKSNTVAILLGQGNGQFQTFVPYSTGGLSGGSPNPVAAADINGDGHLDLVFANPLDSDISVLLNNGSGGFSSTVTSAAVAQFPISIAVADFNKDGILDVASVAYSATSASSVSVLLGKGDGTFSSAANYPTGNAADTDPQFVAAGDFNGDGYPDLAIANFGDNTVSILLNNGDGTFPTSGTIPTYATGIGPTSVAVGDFNGDGILDLAVANSTDGTVSILLGNGLGGKGNGTFGIQKAYSASGVIGAPSPSWIVAADVHDKVGSGNGVLDLVVADTLTPLAPGGKNSGVDAVSVLLGNGDGSFKTATQYSTGTNTAPSSVVVGDFNGDGMPDIATANSGTGSVSVLLNIGSGAFGSATSYAAGQEAVGIAAADLNGSGNLDLIAGTTASFTNTISTLLGNGDGTFQIHVDHATGLSQAPDRRLPVVAGDFNGDGNLDVAVADEQTNVVEVYLNQPAIAFSPGTLTFGSVPVGSSSTDCGQATSTTCTVTVSNTGTTPITLTSIVASGDFTQTNTCPSSSASLAQGTSCTVSVIFTPAASGSRTGSLTVTDSIASSPQALALSGTGVAPAVTLAPASLTFAAQNVGTTSAAQTVTLTNNGSGTLAITSITPSPQFGETNTCGSSVAQGANCTISVTFTPTAAGSQTGTIAITDNASGSPQKITLTGTGNGPAASVSPTTVNFGSQPVGSTSTAQVVTLTNTGNQNLSVTKITTAAPFAQTNNCTTVAANSSCTINVSFSPTASVTSSGAVTITDNAAGSPQTVTLSGTGSTGPFAVLSPASVTFTTTNVGSSSSQTVTLSNTGNASLSITGI
ncbi:MAG TPA: FG-GAP-like repeat-containing protein, partial [Terriglobia bacterium]